ncbi:MAG: NADH-quinone oxidoreductase subunit M [Actinomycetota bacterium]
MKFPVLSVIIFSPLIGSLVIAMMKNNQERIIRWIAVVATAVPLVLAVVVLANFDPGHGVQFVEKISWSKTIGASYYLGVDGISLPMLMLSALLGLIAVIASWSIKLKVKGYYALLLLLMVGILGVFLALDYIMFYIFWELVLLPMYFLIGIWGGDKREYAAIKFFLYTLAGSVIMLLAILAVYFRGGANTFDILALATKGFPAGFQNIIFWGFFAGFAVKVPIVPFHTWLPDAHTEAPTAISVLLAGVLLKMGTYGFIRVIIPTTPLALQKFSGVLAALAVISIIYGALNAMIQKDLKRMIAYSSISHMGYVILGISAMTAIGVNGAIMQMFSHGLITAMLFLLVGYIYERTHTRSIPELGGLLNVVPLLAGALCFASFASLGLPGLSGFVAEFLVLLGSFPVMKVMTAIASTGVVITAGYLLWMLQRVVMGDVPEKLKELKDATPRELITLAPLVLLIVGVGIYPESVLGMVNQSVMTLMKALS